jgi:hypothetical protein
MKILKDSERAPTVSETARALRTTPQCLYKEAHLGRLKIYRLNGLTSIIFPDILKSWLETKTVVAVPLTENTLADRLFSGQIRLVEKEQK